MPDPFERHSGHSADDWGGQPSRSSQRAAAASDQGKRAPGKKDRWAYCKALKGPHDFAFRIRVTGWRRDNACGWGVSWPLREPRWYCVHEEACTGCGKVKDFPLLAERCPDYHPITEAERAQVGRKIAEYEARMLRWTRKRPVTEGPQGYRRPKSG